MPQLIAILTILIVFSFKLEHNATVFPENVVHVTCDHIFGSGHKVPPQN